ncbi:MAG: zinc-dependent peptidase [Burkholderiaceae bacterium]|nr:zinc-dependent peptidase [Burkholderiaceae bacterium]
MIRSLLRRLARAPVAIDDSAWHAALQAVPFLARFSEAEYERLRALVSRFLATKEMAGAGGLELTAAIQLHIAIQACVPVLELGLHWYRGWTSIVVYPAQFTVPRRRTDDIGVVHEYEETLSGEAWEGGPLIVSWDDAARAGRAPSPYSVVIHEFAHKLDMLDGDADGCPPFDPKLHVGMSRAAWQETLHDAFARFSAELDLIEAELPPHIDPESEAADPYYAHLPLDAYAAQSPAEFFAVSSEAFFVDAARLQLAFPDWYALLARFFRQDPLARNMTP